MSWCGSTRSPGARRGCPPTEATASIAVAPPRLQRPQVGAIVDAVRRDRVAVAVPGQEHGGAARHLAEHERCRRLAVGRADDFAMRDRRESDSRVRPLPPMIASMELARMGLSRRPAGVRRNRHGARQRLAGDRGSESVADFMTLSWTAHAGSVLLAATTGHCSRGDEADHVPRPTVQADGREAGVGPVHLLRRADQHQGQRRRARRCRPSRWTSRRSGASPTS